MRQFFSVRDSTDSGDPDLVTLEDVKLELGITTDTEDEALEASITRISRTFAEYLDRIFAHVDVNEIFVFDLGECFKERQPLLLRQYPIIDIQSVTIDGAADDNFEYDQETGRLWRSSGAWSGRIEVDYSGGYDLPTNAPAALQWAVIEAIRQRRSFASSDPTVRSTTHGDTSVTFNSEPVQGAAGFSRIIIDAINPFKRIAI